MQQWQEKHAFSRKEPEENQQSGRAGRATLAMGCYLEDVSLKLGRWVRSKVIVQRKEKDTCEGTRVAIETKRQTPAFLEATYLVERKLVHVFAVIRKEPIVAYCVRMYG